MTGSRDTYIGQGLRQLPSGGASLTDILTALKDTVVAQNSIVAALTRLTPTTTSGQLSANTLVQAGFVRVLGISVTTAGALGTLNDAASVLDAAAGNAVYDVAAATGYLSLNMVFQNGLVYLPGAAQVATIFYSRS